MKDFLKDENKTSEEIENNAGGSEWKFDGVAHTLENDFIEEAPTQTPVEKEKTSEKSARESVKPTKKKKKSPKKAKAKSGNSAIFTCVSLLCAIAIVVLGFLGYGYYNTPNTNEKMNPGNVAMTVGNSEVSLGMYNYYYTCIYQNYLSYAQYGYYDIDTTKDFSQQETTDADGKKTTWDKIFVNDTIDQIKFITAYYEGAVKNNVTLTDSQKESIEEQLDSLKETAATSDMSVDEYISQTYGDYCGYATLKKMLTQCYLAENYYQQKLVEDSVTDEEVNDYFEKNKDEYISAKIAYLNMTYDASDAKAKAKTEKQAKEYAKNIKSVLDMKAILPTACKDLIKQAVEGGYFEDEDQAASTLSDNIETSISKSDQTFTEEGLEWLFSDKSKVGDCKTFTDTTNSVVYIVLKTAEPELPKDTLYTVRHILIMPEADKKENADKEENQDSEEKTEYTEAQWKAAKKKADNILAEYSKGKKDEYSFALLAEKYSEDTESTSKGQSGLFGGLIAATPIGQMVPAFENWSVDKSRKYGDVDIVKSDFGYHIMYFVSNDKSYIYDCKNAVLKEKEDSFVKKTPVVKNKRNMKKAKVAKPTASENSSHDDDDDAAE